MSSPQLSDHPVALVTGGTKGIGLACAEALHAAGHQVAVTYRSTPPSAEMLERFLCIQCDVRSSEDVDVAVSAVEDGLGQVEVLVANAGIAANAVIFAMSDEEWDSVLDTNLTGVFRFVRRVIKPMGRVRAGRIILMSSIAGINGSKGQANYAASKAGLTGLGRTAAMEYAKRNVTVNVIAPGPMDSELMRDAGEAVVNEIVKSVPAGRLGEKEDVAAAVVFLAGPHASYITGVVLPIDGGWCVG